MKRYMILSIAICCAACQPHSVSPPSAIGPVPSEAQMQWHEMEMNAFVHFTVNTFTDKEWGMGDESEQLFAPTALDAEQWAQVIADAGCKGIILTCKHHDGFCLWPSAYTTHSVANSPYLSGKGDIVKSVSEACKKHGLKFGIYVSPWDRNHKDYGREEYLTYYRNQLTELFRNYGPIFEMWFDGANGGTGYYGGANEQRTIQGSTYYDWPATLNLVRQFNPDVIFFSDAGPSVRWVGNEKGVAGATNWSMITPDTLYAGKPGIEALLNRGSESGSAWIPAEVDVSIRPGWFYHASEDSLVKTPEQLFEIYLTSVGRGSTLLLNIPPDRRGLINERDVASLQGFRRLLNERLGTNLAKGAKASADNFRGSDDNYGPNNLVDGKFDTYWATDDTVSKGIAEIAFGGNQSVSYIVLQEYIKLGQRVKSFEVEAMVDGKWQKVGAGSTIGYKRIIHIPAVSTSKLKLKILDARACPVISAFEAY